MNLKIILALALVAIGVAIGVSSFKKSVTPYISFAEARRATGMVQVNGQIADKNYVLKPSEQYLQFNLRDQQGQVTMVVAIGRYKDQCFQAEQLLVKCPSKYQAEAEKKTPRS